MHRLTRLVATVLLLVSVVASPAGARQLGCQYDAFGTSTDLVVFTPETSPAERSIVLAALDTTAYDLGGLVSKMGRPLTVSVNGPTNFAGAFFVVVADFQSRTDTQIFLMHEIGHVHDEWMMTDADRQQWAWLHPGIVLDTYNVFGWKAWDAFYFDRPAEAFAFEFSSLYKPCSGTVDLVP